MTERRLTVESWEDGDTLHVTIGGRTRGDHYTVTRSGLVLLHRGRVQYTHSVESVINAVRGFIPLEDGTVYNLRPTRDGGPSARLLALHQLRTWTRPDERTELDGTPVVVQTDRPAVPPARVGAR